MGIFTSKKPNEKHSGEILAVEHSGLLAEVWDWIKSIAIALLVVAVVHQYGFHLSTVKGASMQPTLEEDEWLFINKTIRYIGTVGRGDVIVVKEPNNTEAKQPYLVKRIVAVAGDEVRIQQGKLYINGLLTAESYTDSPIEDGRFESMTIPAGSVFLMGDNRHRYASNDSRSFGAVSVDKVEGRAEMILWPFSKIKIL
ncbi:signal peptidase I [Paenibacillus agricola]|uniref:Signal peptidase I n=1 Tax=Paenibacillus agricola TaxID=2716264 RepID=A0ABX0J8K5_9BACL|nr:signal peptidase I [Paenibacillus agricola]NHN32303.1 signal peptidase I [Paenibacillus agricola]